MGANVREVCGLAIRANTRGYKDGCQHAKALHDMTALSEMLKLNLLDSRR